MSISIRGAAYSILTILLLSVLALPALASDEIPELPPVASAETADAPPIEGGGEPEPEPPPVDIESSDSSTSSEFGEESPLSSSPSSSAPPEGTPSGEDGGEPPAGESVGEEPIIEEPVDELPPLEPVAEAAAVDYTEPLVCILFMVSASFGALLGGLFLRGV